MPWRLRHAEQVKQGGRDIYLPAWFIDPPLVRKQSRIDDEQRHLQLFVVYRKAMHSLTVFAKRLAMIARDYQQGVIGQPLFLKLIGQLSNQSINRVHCVEIATQRRIGDAIILMLSRSVGMMGILRKSRIAMYRRDHFEPMIQQELVAAVLYNRA